MSDIPWPTDDPIREDRDELVVQLLRAEAEAVALLSVVPYDDYLHSAHWQRTRQLALEHYGRSCFSCGATSQLQVHHRTYERVGSERLRDLAVVCDDCHRRIHRKAA